MRRLFALLCVMAMMMGFAPAVSAAEVCFGFTGHNDLEGNAETGEFAGTTVIKFDGFPVEEGTLEGHFITDTQATGTFTFEEGSFTDITENLIQLRKNGTAQFRFTGEIIGGTGAGEGATGYNFGRGVVHIDENGIDYHVMAKFGGTICLPNGDEA